VSKQLARGAGDFCPFARKLPASTRLLQNTPVRGDLSEALPPWAISFDARRWRAMPRLNVTVPLPHSSTMLMEG
jgi:hypothetical protein